MDTTVLGQVLSALLQGAGGQAGQQAWTALAALTRRLLGRQAAETTAVEAAPAGAEDPAAPGRLAGLLAGRAAADPGFAAELGQWLAGTQALLGSGHTTVNQVGGTVSGTVIQAGDVFGGIRFGGPPGPAA
jgi:hypothetical protein